MRIDETKTAAGRRTLPLPAFAATVLSARRGVPYFGEQTMIFRRPRDVARPGQLPCPLA